MGGFLHRLARLNAPFLSKSLRALAEQIEKLFPTQPVMATPPIFHDSKGVPSMGMISVQDDAAPLHATVVFLDAEGNEATPDDVPSWTSDNEAAATVEASEDGLSGTVTIGAPGAAIISVDTTNTDGSTVHSQGTITVLSGDVVSGDVQFDTGEATA